MRAPLLLRRGRTTLAPMSDLVVDSATGRCFLVRALVHPDNGVAAAAARALQQIMLLHAALRGDAEALASRDSWAVCSFGRIVSPFLVWRENSLHVR